MEEDAQGLDSDSDETVIEGSVTESEPEDEELPWRRLFFDQDTSLRSEFSVHHGINGLCKGMLSPEIQLGCKLSEGLQEQMNENKTMTILNVDTVLQQPQDETAQNQALLQPRKKFPMFTVSSPQAGLLLNHQNVEEPEDENIEVLPHPEMGLSEDRDSPEISLLSGTAVTVSAMLALKEKSLTEPEKISIVPPTFSESGKEITLTSTENKDEESSLETFVSDLERLLTSTDSTQEERLFEIINDFDPEILSNSPTSIALPLNASSAYSTDLLENTKDDALPAELLAALNTLSETKLGSICHTTEEGNSLHDENECLEVEPVMSQTDDDCTQIAEVNFKSLHSTSPLEQSFNLAGLHDNSLPVQQVGTLEDPHPFELQILAHQNVTSFEPQNNKGNSNSVENAPDQEIPRMLRRSSRLEKLKVSRGAKCTHDMCKMPEKILPKVLSCEDLANKKSSTKNFRMQNRVLMMDGKGKNTHSSRFKSEPIRKNEQLTVKNEKVKMNKIRLSCMNRRNVFGENLLYKAVLHNDVDLVHHCIKKGANVNQPSYAGWTALHEASVGGFYRIASELLKGGADVNIKGMYQITPLHDAVINGHYKVAELLLLNGADPLFRSDNGKCALDEARDACMRRLLERYVPKRQKCRTSARRNSTNSADVEDVHQHKKPKLSYKNRIGFVHNENSKRRKLEHVEVKKGNKDGLFINKEDVYEHYQKDTKTTKFGKLKHKQSTVNQMYTTGLSRVSLRNDKDASPNVSKCKGRRNTQHKSTHVDDRDCTSGQTITISSSRRINRLDIGQQHLQTHNDLPEESCEPSSATMSDLKSGLDNNIETCSVSKEAHTPSLDLSDSQVMQFLELESIGQTEAVSFSGLSVHKEIKLPLVTTDQHPHTQEQHSSPYRSYENSNSNKKDVSLNKWENSFLSFVKENFYTNDNDCCTSEETVASEKAMYSTESKSYNYEENLTNRKEMDFQQVLLSEDHFSREKELKADSLTTLQQQKAINLSNSDNIVISDKHIANHIQCISGTSFDHSHDNPEKISMAYTRTLSTHEVSKLTSHVELLKNPQYNSARESTPLMNQTDTHIVEKVYTERKQDTKRNYTNKGPRTSSSNKPFPTVVHCQGVEIIEVEKRRQDLTEGEPMHHTDFHSTDNMNEELTIISQLNQKEEEEISHKPDGELTDINGDESTVRSCEDGKEKMDSEIYMSPNKQEHKKGRTSLHEASDEESDDIIVELLKAGADVNCENVDGILPLHDAVSSNHLKAADILLQHGTNPNKKGQEQKTALDEAKNEKMKELLKSYGAMEANNRDESNATVTVKIPAVRSKRPKQCFCDGNKNVDPSSLSHQEKTRENLPMHETISVILRDIEEKQENLLVFEIRNPEDAEQYIEKMLEIKEIMDDVLAKQKAERDDLAKKYRVSIESFKHGALREQLANLATRQKSLLVVAKKQKKIRLKIEKYKNVTSLPGLSLRKLPSNSDISSEKNTKELTSLENSVQPQSGSLSHVNIACGNMQETPLSLETCNDSHNTNLCLNSEAVRREKFSGNEMNSKQNVNNCSFDGLLKTRYPDGTDNIKLSSQHFAFIAQAEYSQKENDRIETTDKDCEFYHPSAVTGTLSGSECTSVLSRKDTLPSTVIWDQNLPQYDPKRGNKKTSFQQSPGVASGCQAHQGIVVLDTDTVHQMKPYLEKPATIPHINDSQTSSSSGSGYQHITKKPLNYNTAPKKKCMQIKDLILLGRMNPGNNILEFKTQETVHKASVLLNGKIKVENGQIYQNPVTWLKDLLGGDSYVTWNYAWSKVTYLGKELLKYVSEEAYVLPEPNVAPQHQPCLPGSSRESVQSIPHHLQINEILLINEQEFLPCHIMDQHWKFYVECEELTF